MGEYQPLVSAGVLTISDSGFRGERVDASGEIASDILEQNSIQVVLRDVVPDDLDVVTSRLRGWCDGGDVKLVVTTGGTGLGSRDITPEATRAVIEREIPGFAEAMRICTMDKTPMAMLSRSVSGVRAGCLIVNLPGSPSGVRETLGVVLPAIPHAIGIIAGERNHPIP